LFDPALGLLRVIILLEIGYHNVRALTCESDRDRSADAGIGSRNDGGFSSQSAAAFVRMLAVIGFRSHLAGSTRRRLLLSRLRRLWAAGFIVWHNLMSLLRLWLFRAKNSTLSDRTPCATRRDRRRDGPPASHRGVTRYADRDGRRRRLAGRDANIVPRPRTPCPAACWPVALRASCIACSSASTFRKLAIIAFDDHRDERAQLRAAMLDAEQQNPPRVMQNDLM
jgi:hypothetical protein